jgi:uncharacterized membrane protein SirB2
MSYEVYKLLHLLGIFLLFGALGGLAAIRVATSPGRGEGKAFKILHGIALALMLVAGFGMLARLGMGSPGTWGAWVWIKIVIWLLLGAAVVALKKAGKAAPAVLVLLTVLGLVSAWAALFKP